MVVLKIGREAIQGFDEGMETLVSQMGVAGRCLGALMTQEFLDYPQVDALLQQMRRV